ncbi:ROK family transcriptional regulator [Lacrimispora indolis]|uniref:ROK family transcriptional regulator n=1 Tax=Lacrimispora indolis TaxID=69825 RepID=UPI000422327E|nr:MULTISPECIES: ROK family transcriptional regulator [Lachnospiraceae]MBE7720144.1 ROK family transcriptional regulator [Lacrimispora celerecrescens]
MGYTGINLENVKVSNRSAILKLLNDHGAMSRKDIAMELGLTPATVTLICTDLIAAGILLEKGEMAEEKRAGRKKVSIDINYRYKYVLSVSIEAPETCIAISDLKGCLKGLKKIKTETSLEPQAFLKKIADESKHFMWEQGVSRDAVLGAGLSIPGPVKRDTGVSLHAYRIWNEAVPVGEYMKMYLNLPVVVDNNVKAFAEGELIYGTGKKQENLLFIKWGPGVGSAIIIQNKIYDSQNSKTAEIGHYIVEPGGLPCRCGRRGCLETHVATHAIADRVRRACTRETMPGLYAFVEGDVDRIEVRNMEQWIEVDDPGLQKIIDDIVERLARTVVNTITLLAPDKVIIYGFMFEMDNIQKRFLNFCTYYDPLYNGSYILKSELSDRIGYIGPLAIAVNELFLGT